MTDRIFLLDGMGLAFRAYFAIRGLTNSKGKPTNAIFGFTRMLLRIIEEHDPKYMAVIFDYPDKTFRDDIYPEYKANRPEAPPEFKSQIPHMDEVIEAFKIPMLRVQGVEADDVLATLAQRAAKDGMEAVIVAGDKDLLQVVHDNIKMYDAFKGDNGTWYDEDAVKERYGVPPKAVVDILALMGDSSDNIPGVRGIGEKTARKLLEKYGDVDNLYAHIDDLKGKQKEKLIEDKDKAYLSRELVTIKTDVDVDLNWEDCRVEPPDRERLFELFSQFEFHTLRDEYFDNNPDDKEELDYQLVLTEDKLEEVIGEMRLNGAFAVDTETTSTAAMEADLVGISLSCRDGTGYYIPVGHTLQAMHPESEELELFTEDETPGIGLDKTLAMLKPLFEDPFVNKVGHNLKYDLIVLRRAGVDLRGISMDTMVTSYLTDPSRLRHNLSEVSLHYLRRKLIPIADLIGKGAKATTFDNVPVDKACIYACEDADMAWRLSEHFRPLLKERALEDLFDKVELPLLYVLAGMEMAGIAINEDLFQELHKEIEGRLAALEGEIHDLAEGPFSINSPKQLQEVLFTRLGLKPIKKTKTGYSTDVEVLEQLAHEHALPEKILEYRMLDKLRGTYVEALPKLVNKRTGRIHTSFNQAVAATGRLSSSDPNLQNIPVRSEIGKRIREGFIPGKKTYKLISADYSQIELRILAHLAGDENLKQAFFQDADIHRDTASRVFGVAAENVTPDMRRQAKAVNFGVVYGISPFGLGRNLGISQGEAKKFIDAYFKSYPGVRQWIDGILEEAKETGYVTTLLNRRRYVHELNSSDQNVRRQAERVAMNTPVQGSAADIIKLAMVRLDEALKEWGARMLLQVHDELVVEGPDKHAADIAESMREIMENTISLDVPLKVDVGIGINWAEIH